MIECSKCRVWYHNECTQITPSDAGRIRLFFCAFCSSTNPGLETVYKQSTDYAKEPSKPIFKAHAIISVYNLYTYHVLLEFYKILKFRVPYCLYELFTKHSPRREDHHGLYFIIPKNRLSFEKSTFIYQAILSWNSLYKSILTPENIELHKSCKIKGDQGSSILVTWDYSTSTSTFKARLKKIIIDHQHSPLTGTLLDWHKTDTLSHSA